MAESGQSWQRTFKGLPDQAGSARRWVRGCVDHVDAEQVVGELFGAVLGAGPDLITVTVSTAGDRIRLTAVGSEDLPARHTHGPGRRIIDALSDRCGVTTDGCGLWSQLTTEANP
ncbi:hypothetical protein [Streptomyces sp. TP-A0875]|uniref:hypothetical protein n=1 Tax=Streptomyces sp. TP-A0875 TaxID=552354 RepID=UPI0006B6739A|nr:hypothetical protein [Streptomyces sp. TP-A0875]